jgi:ribosome-associated toxin RatA of RatAB toxin-antitoxin module
VTAVNRSAIVRHSPQQMFELVSDVAAYARRFAWCEASEVLDQGAHEQVARLVVRMGAMRTSFTTRNRLDPPHRIGLALLEGPFTQLAGAWHFQPLGGEACKVTLELDFELAGRVVGSALAFGFQGLADRMVDDFCREARRIHG